MGIASINPATGETIQTFKALSDSELEQKLAKAAATFEIYKTTSFAERGTWLNAAAQVLEDNK